MSKVLALPLIGLGLMGLTLIGLVRFGWARVPDVPPGSDEPVEFSDRERRKIGRLSPLGPVPPDPTNRVADDPSAAHLGRWLFFDTRLSGNGEVSCATCHDPAKGFGDDKTLAEAIGTGTRHTPTILNAAYNRWFFWDGRADSLWAQATGPIENPIEMDGDRLAVAHLLSTDAELSRAYETVFGPLPDLSDATRFPPHARPIEGEPEHPHRVAWDAMTEADRDTANRIFTNVAKSIAAYERLLVRGDAPFDRFARGLAEGDDEALAALSASGQRGLELFVGRGSCVLCHNGPNFTDSEFHNTSAPPLGGGALTDPGRYTGAAEVVRSAFNAAGAYSDDTDGPEAARVRSLRQTSETWGEFKTPSLRNVTLTKPFMHQGQFEDLRAVLEFYSTLEGAAGRNHHQEQILVPLRLTAGETADLIAFLSSLEGAPIDERLLSPPDSPVMPTGGFDEDDR